MVDVVIVSGSVIVENRSNKTFGESNEDENRGSHAENFVILTQ